MPTFRLSASIIAYLALIVGTNVAFALIGPAFLTFVLAGLTMTARDFVHDYLGRRGAFGLVLIGTAASFLLAAPGVAFASLLAFLVAETLDLLVYERARTNWGRPVGIALSGTVGAAVDSLVFLTIAFGSLAFFPAQFVGKAGANLVAAGLAVLRSRR